MIKGKNIKKVDTIKLKQAIKCNRRCLISKFTQNSCHFIEKTQIFNMKLIF